MQAKKAVTFRREAVVNIDQCADYGFCKILWRNNAKKVCVNLDI